MGLLDNIPGDYLAAGMDVIGALGTGSTNNYARYQQGLLAAEEQSLAERKQLLEENKYADVRGDLSAYQGAATGLLDGAAPTLQQIQERRMNLGVNTANQNEAIKQYNTRYGPQPGTGNMTEYAKAISQGYGGSFMDYMQQMKSAGATQISNVMNMPTLTKGQEAIDKKYADDYLEFTRGGGADYVKQLSQLKDVHKSLGEKDNLTGPIVGSIPDLVAPIFAPEATAAKDQVEEVVQRNLKAVLGAQFTEKEGERLIARAYNPRLDEAENKKRVGRLIVQMESAYEAKKSAAQYMEKHGTMQGWKGRLPTIADFDTALDGPGAAKPSSVTFVRDANGKIVRQ